METNRPTRSDKHAPSRFSTQITNGTRHRATGRWIRVKANESLGIKSTWWDAANKLRGNMDSAEYKQVALGFISLKYESDAFTEQCDLLERTLSNPTSPDHVDDEADRQDILESRDHSGDGTAPSAVSASPIVVGVTIAAIATWKADKLAAGDTSRAMHLWHSVFWMSGRDLRQ